MKELSQEPVKRIDCFKRILVALFICFAAFSSSIEAQSIGDSPKGAWESYWKGYSFSDQPTRITRQAVLNQHRQLRADARTSPAEGVFGSDSMLWKMWDSPAVHYASARMAVLQLAHPLVFEVIRQTSFGDPISRLENTRKSLHLMIYGDQETAFKEALRLQNIHQGFGRNPQDGKKFQYKGRTIAPADIDLHFWIWGLTFESLHDNYQKTERKLTPEENKKFYSEAKLLAKLMGIPDRIIPETLSGFQRVMSSLYSKIEVHPRARKALQGLFEDPKLLTRFIKSKNELSERQHKRIVAAIKTFVGDSIPEHIAVGLGVKPKGESRTASWAKRVLLDKVVFWPKRRAAKKRKYKPTIPAHVEAIERTRGASVATQTVPLSERSRRAAERAPNTVRNLSFLVSRLESPRKNCNTGPSRNCNSLEQLLKEFRALIGSKASFGGDQGKLKDTYERVRQEYETRAAKSPGFAYRFLKYDLALATSEYILGEVDWDRILSMSHVVHYGTFAGVAAGTEHVGTKVANRLGLGATGRFLALRIGGYSFAMQLSQMASAILENPEDTDEIVAHFLSSDGMKDLAKTVGAFSVAQTAVKSLVPLYYAVAKGTGSVEMLKLVDKIKKLKKAISTVKIGASFCPGLFVGAVLQEAIVLTLAQLIMGHLERNEENESLRALVEDHKGIGNDLLEKGTRWIRGRFRPEMTEEDYAKIYDDVHKIFEKQRALILAPVAAEAIETNERIEALEANYDTAIRNAFSMIPIEAYKPIRKKEGKSVRKIERRLRDKLKKRDRVGPLETYVKEAIKTSDALSEKLAMEIGDPMDMKNAWSLYELKSWSEIREKMNLIPEEEERILDGLDWRALRSKADLRKALNERLLSAAVTRTGMNYRFTGKVRTDVRTGHLYKPGTGSQSERFLSLAFALDQRNAEIARLQARSQSRQLQLSVKLMGEPRESYSWQPQVTRARKLGIYPEKGPLVHRAMVELLKPPATLEESYKKQQAYLTLLGVWKAQNLQRNNLRNYVAPRHKAPLAGAPLITGQNVPSRIELDIDLESRSADYAMSEVESLRVQAQKALAESVDRYESGARRLDDVGGGENREFLRRARALPF